MDNNIFLSSYNCILKKKKKLAFPTSVFSILTENFRQVSIYVHVPVCCLSVKGNYNFFEYSETA